MIVLENGAFSIHGSYFFLQKNWGWWWQAPQAEPPEPKCWSRIFFTDATDTLHESIFCQLFDFLAISRTIQHLIWDVWYILKMKYFFHCLLEETLGGAGGIFWNGFFLKWFASTNCTKFPRSSSAICTDLKELSVFTSTEYLKSNEIRWLLHTAIFQYLH